MAKGLFRRSVTGYVPHDERSTDLWAKHKPGQLVEVDVKVPRNIKSQGLYWAMLTKLGKSIGKPSELLHTVLKFKTGHVQMIKTKSGLVPHYPSTSFEAMDDVQFSKYLDACIEVIKQEWLPHMSQSAIRQELEGMLAA